MADVTKLAQLVDPQVMGDMISAELPKLIKFQGVAPIDTTLQGQPGSTITLPKYKYIGDAKVVAEGAAIDYSQLETETAQHTIKKVAQGVKLTDEAVLSGYGNPVGEATRQIAMSVAAKIDNDTVEEARKTTLSVSAPSDVTMIDAIETAFDDETDETGVLFVSPKTAAKLRSAATTEFTRATDLGDDVLVKGAFGELLGWVLVRTKKVEDNEAIAVKRGGLQTFLKRGFQAESQRDIDHKLTKFNGDQHYVVALVDESKVVKVELTESGVETP